MENTIKVRHPEFGLVTFSMMTHRQMQVLKKYVKLTDEEDNKINKANKQTKKK